MTGSAFKAMDVVVACLSYEMGGGLEEGGLNIRPGAEAGGFFFYSFGLHRRGPDALWTEKVGPGI